MSRSINPMCSFVRPQGETYHGFAPVPLIVLMSLRPAIPWRVALLHSSPPLYRPESILNPPAETVNHHLSGAEEFSTGDLGNFQPALTANRFGRFSTLAGAQRCGSSLDDIFRRAALRPVSPHTGAARSGRFRQSKSASVVWPVLLCPHLCNGTWPAAGFSLQSVGFSITDYHCLSRFQWCVCRRRNRPEPRPQRTYLRVSLEPERAICDISRVNR